MNVEDLIQSKKTGEFTESELALIANEIRFRIVDMVNAAACGHPGGALGLADIYAVLYCNILNIDVKNITLESRDRFLLSHGHVCAVRYSAMALKGFFPVDELKTFRKFGTRLQGHPSTRYLPEVENSSGSLGQGLSNASGVALGLRHQNNKAHVFVGISDGECQEGMTWEAAMSAAHYKLDNLTAFIDYNNIQIDGFVSDVMSVADLGEKFSSFGWNVIRSDGHNIAEIEKSFHEAKSYKRKPSVIIFKTMLGKDISFMENKPGWHGVAPSDEQKEEAFKELTLLREEIQI